MMKIEIRTENEAFRNPFTGEHDSYAEAMELRRILESVIEKLEWGYTTGNLTDINGNHVGEWSR